MTSWNHCIAEDSRIPKTPVINPLNALVHRQTEKTILYGLPISNPNFSEFAFLVYTSVNVDINFPGNWWVSQLQNSKFSVLLLGFQTLGLELDNRGRTTENDYHRIYSLWFKKPALLACATCWLSVAFVYLTVSFISSRCRCDSWLSLSQTPFLSLMTVIARPSAAQSRQSAAFGRGFRTQVEDHSAAFVQAWKPSYALYAGIRVWCLNDVFVVSPVTTVFLYEELELTRKSSAIFVAENLPVSWKFFVCMVVVLFFSACFFSRLISTPFVAFMQLYVEMSSCPLSNLVVVVVRWPARRLRQRQNNLLYVNSRKKMKIRENVETRETPSRLRGKPSGLHFVQFYSH